MSIDHVKLLTSNSPKPACYCEALNPRYITNRNTNYWFAFLPQEVKVIDWDAVCSIDDINAILKALGIYFTPGKLTKISTIF